MICSTAALASSVGALDAFALVSADEGFFSDESGTMAVPSLVSLLATAFPRKFSRGWGQ